MSFNVRDQLKKNYAVTEPGEEVVISGISGRFPESRNVIELKNNLMNKVDLITDNSTRWRQGNLTWNYHRMRGWVLLLPNFPTDHAEIPKAGGKVTDLNKFDAIFFGVHYKQAHTMDPMCRLLMEHAYEAVIDAGINPKLFKGSNTGVVIGSCVSESEKTWFYEKLQVTFLFQSIFILLDIFFSIYFIPNIIPGERFRYHRMQQSHAGQQDIVFHGSAWPVLRNRHSLQLEYVRLGSSLQIDSKWNVRRCDRGWLQSLPSSLRISSILSSR